MMSRLRSLRLLAFVLLLSVPGLGGSVLQVAHPCAEAMPWLQGAEGAGAGHDHHGSAPDERSPSGGGCHCVGACQATIIAPPLGGSEIAVAGPRLERHTRVVHLESFIPVARPSDRLPPSTAPPSA